MSDKPKFRQPLPERLYQEQREYLKGIKGLDSSRGALGLIEDKLIHINAWIAAPFTNKMPEQIPIAEDAVRLDGFYKAVLFRYLQKEMGYPEKVQNLADFNTPQGNQVDMFLAEFFGVK